MNDRCYDTITAQDLKKLKTLALKDFNGMLKRNPHLKPLQKLKLGIAFCQGAALHYAAQKLDLAYSKVEAWVQKNADRKLGIKDFDIFFFFKKGAKKYPERRRGIADFEKFGTTPNSTGKAKNFTGRRVDIMGRSIELNKGEDFEAALTRYLREGKTQTAQYLAQKAVVLLEPEPCGKVIWIMNQPVNEVINNPQWQHKRKTVKKEGVIPAT